EKIRLAAIDTPELDAENADERARAIEARDRLVALINARRFRIERRGHDRYGRTLARLITARGSIGDELVAAGLARRW
ncbi:MAG: thermonuclease family protein, partial [Pseudomonadota bacterium]